MTQWEKELEGAGGMDVSMDDLVEIIEERCECGQLMCKYVLNEYIEIKCRRCRRLHVISIRRLKDFKPGYHREHGRAKPEISQRKYETVSPEKAVYVAYLGADKFHELDCRFAWKIRPENKLNFATREQAIKAGYKPCGVCRP